MMSIQKENKMNVHEGISEQKEQNLQSWGFHDEASALNALQNQTESSEAQRTTEQSSNTLKWDIEKKKYENLPLKTYIEVVKGTPLEQKLIKILSHPDFDNEKEYPDLKGKTPEKRLEYVFQKINTAIVRFYARKFDIELADPLPSWLYQTLVPATEVFLMDMLKENKQENNINFLAQLWSLKIDGLFEAFQWVKTFSEKFTLPYQKGKKLMKILDFLSLPKNRSDLKKLNNPYDFYQKVMNSKIWENENLKLENIHLNQFWLFSQDEKDKFSGELEKIRSEIWSIQVVDSPETVKKVLSLVGKSDAILEKTDKLSAELLDTMDSFKSVDETLQKTLGFNIFSQITSSPFMKWVADFFLNLLGFSGGLEGLERRWRKRNIDREVDVQKKEFINQTFEAYLEKKTNPDLEQTKKFFSENGIEVEEQDLPKFILDYSLLETQIIDNLNHVWKINPQLLQSLSGDGFNGADFVEEEKNSQGKTVLKVKSDFLSSEENKRAFSKLYLPKMLNSLAQNEDYLKTVKNTDDIAFMLVSGVVLEETNLIEWFRLGSIIPEDFYVSTSLNSLQSERVASSSNVSEGVEEISLWSKFLNAAKEIIITGESQGQYGAVNQNDKGMASIGLMQRRWPRAVELLKQMREKNSQKFESIMKDPLFKNLNQIQKPRTKTQADQFNNLMKISEFQNVMENQIQKDLSQYVEDIQSWWLYDPRAVLATMRIYNAWPWFARKSVIDQLWSHEKNNYQAIIAQYNKTLHGKDYAIFSKNNITEIIKNYTWEIDLA